MRKNERERKVLEETLALARCRGGESRRNADRISGHIIQGESPDFVVDTAKCNNGKPAILAIEHFRVDHFSELNMRRGHQDSLAVIERNRAEKIQQMWHPSSFETDIPQDVLDAIGLSFAKCLEANFKANFAGYMKSFIDSLNNHIAKLNTYRKNACKRLGRCETVRLALLIELHSDFSDSFLHDGGICCRPKTGQLLLFDDMVERLREQRENIDFVIFGSYEALKDNLVDAAIIRPTLLEKSLKRNKLSSLRYLGEDRDKAIYMATKIKPSTTITNGRIDIELERESQGMSIEEHMDACLKCLPKVISANMQNRSFITTISMQLFLEIYGEVLHNVRHISRSDLEMAHSFLGREEVDRRTRRFEEKWFPDTA